MLLRIREPNDLPIWQQNEQQQKPGIGKVCEIFVGETFEERREINGNPTFITKRGVHVQTVDEIIQRVSRVGIYSHVRFIRSAGAPG